MGFGCPCFCTKSVAAATTEYKAKNKGIFGWWEGGDVNNVHRGNSMDMDCKGNNYSLVFSGIPCYFLFPPFPLGFLFSYLFRKFYAFTVAKKMTFMMATRR